MFLERHSVTEIYWRLVKTLGKGALSENTVRCEHFKNEGWSVEDQQRGSQRSWTKGQERLEEAFPEARASKWNDVCSLSSLKDWQTIGMTIESVDYEHFTIVLHLIVTFQLFSKLSKKHITLTPPTYFPN